MARGLPRPRAIARWTELGAVFAGVVLGLFLGGLFSEHLGGGAKATMSEGPQILSSLVAANQVNAQLLSGMNEIKAQLRAPHHAQSAAAVEAAVTKALVAHASATATAVAQRKTTPTVPCPVCPVCSKAAPPAAAAADDGVRPGGSKVAQSETAAAGAGAPPPGKPGTPVEFASPFANQPGLMNKLGCRVTNVPTAGAVQCTDKVGGNTPTRQFVRDSKKGLDTPHGYDRWYEPMFRHLRDRKIRLLEIGMKDGASAHLWTKYFPQAEVYGLDYDPKQLGAKLELNKDGVKVVIGDQGKVEDLSRLVKQTGGKFDIIIDDGGHASTQQLVSFDYLFRHALKPGGIYSCEDIETSYWTNADMYSFHVESGLHKYGTAMEAFKQIADSVNRVYIPPHTLPSGAGELGVFRSGVDALVESIQFTANCVIMTKKGVWGDGWDTRDQYNMYLAHENFYDKTKKNVLGKAVDSIDKDRAIQRKLLNDHMLPSVY